MTEESENARRYEQLRRLEARVGVLEKIAVSVPVLVAEVLLVISLFVPFVVTKRDGSDVETFNFFQFVGHLLQVDADGDTDGYNLPFGLAFVVLLVVVAGSILLLPYVTRGPLSATLSRVVTAAVALLVLGSAGGWAALGIGLRFDSREEAAAAPLLLALGALVAALVTFLPAYRKVWAARGDKPQDAR